VLNGQPGPNFVEPQYAHFVTFLLISPPNVMFFTLVTFGANVVIPATVGTFGFGFETFGFAFAFGLGFAALAFGLGFAAFGFALAFAFGFAALAFGFAFAFVVFFLVVFVAMIFS
jgi:hypothetical protein